MPDLREEGIRKSIASRVKLILGRNAPFFGGAGWLVGSTVAAQVVTVLASPVLTRLYTPADFGALAVYGGLLGMLVVVSSARFEVAIPLPRTAGMAASLLVLSALGVLVTAALVGAIVGLFGAELAHLFQADALAGYMWLLPLGVLGGGLYKAASYWSIRRGAYPLLARTKVVQTLGQVSSQIGLALMVSGPLGLVVGQIAGQSLGTGSLARLSLRDLRHDHVRITPHRLRVAARRYRRFPLISAPAALVNTAGLVLPAVVLAALFGPVAAGLFALVKRVMDVPMRMMGNSVAQAMLGHAASQGVNRERVRRLMVDAMLTLLVIGLVPFGLLLAFGPWLFDFVFGAEWREAGVYAQWLAVPLLLQFVSAPSAQMFNVFEQQHLHLIWNVVRLALVLAALWLASRLATAPLSAVIAYGAATAVAYVTLVFMLIQSTRVRE